MTKKILIIGGGVFLAALAVFTGNTLLSAGVFRTIEPHYRGQCTRVEGVVGAEDITIDPLTGVAYISAMDRRLLASTGEHQGGIYTYIPGSFDRPEKLASDLEGDFHPHGIGLWKGRREGEADRLFVVTHPLDADGNGTSQVDVFDLGDAGLAHVRTVKPDRPISLNDVAAAGRDRFYASIDRGSETALGQTLEIYGQLARGGIMLGDGDSMQRLPMNLVYPNGVQVNRKGTMLYVAETTGQRIIAYGIEAGTGALTKIAERRVDTALDNIEITASGWMWVAAHPKTFAFLDHAKDAANNSPSQVVRFRAEGDSFQMREVYMNAGEEISGASVAAPAGRRMLIGSVFEPFILDCGP